MMILFVYLIPAFVLVACYVLSAEGLSLFLLKRVIDSIFGIGAPSRCSMLITSSLLEPSRAGFSRSFIALSKKTRRVVFPVGSSERMLLFSGM